MQEEEHFGNPITRIGSSTYAKDDTIPPTKWTTWICILYR